jgi:hypothetical protein
MTIVMALTVYTLAERKLRRLNAITTHLVNHWSTYGM